MPHSLGDGIRAVNEQFERDRDDALDLVKSLGPDRLTRLMMALSLALVMDAKLMEQATDGQMGKDSHIEAVFSILRNLTSKEIERDAA